MIVTVPIPPGVDPLSDRALDRVVDSVVALADAGRIPRCPHDSSPVWARTPEDRVPDLAQWRASPSGEIVCVTSRGYLDWGGPTRWEPQRPSRPERWTYAIEEIGGQKIRGLFFVEQLRARWPRVLDVSADAQDAALMLRGLFVCLAWLGCVTKARFP